MEPAANPPNSRPLAYLLLTTHRLCTYCNHMHTNSELMLQSEIPARFGSGKVLRSEPIKDFTYRLPLKQITRQATTLACTYCDTTALLARIAALPAPPSLDPSRLTSTTASATTTTTPTAAKPARPHRPRTVDEVLDLF